MSRLSHRNKSFFLSWGNNLLFIFCFFFFRLSHVRIGKITAAWKTLLRFNDSRKVASDLIAQLWGFISGSDVKSFEKKIQSVLVLLQGFQSKKATSKLSKQKGRKLTETCVLTEDFTKRKLEALKLFMYVQISFISCRVWGEKILKLNHGNI